MGMNFERVGLGLAMALGTLACSGAALAAPAGAATIAVASGCYVNANPLVGTPVTVVGSGWTPNDQVAVSGPNTDGTATVAADGTFSVTIEGPILLTALPAAETSTLKAYDQTSGSPPVTTTITSANLAFEVKPASAPFTRHVRFSFSGFLPGKPIYAHYLHRGRVTASQRFGVAKGVCGLLTARALQYPGGHPRYNSYVVQFDDSRRYSKHSTPRIMSRVSVVRF